MTPELEDSYMTVDEDATDDEEPENMPPNETSNETQSMELHEPQDNESQGDGNLTEPDDPNDAQSMNLDEPQGDESQDNESQADGDLTEPEEDVECNEESNGTPHGPQADHARGGVVGNRYWDYVAKEGRLESDTVDGVAVVKARGVLDSAVENIRTLLQSGALGVFEIVAILSMMLRILEETAEGNLRSDADAYKCNTNDIAGTLNSLMLESPVYPLDHVSLFEMGNDEKKHVLRALHSEFRNSEEYRQAYEEVYRSFECDVRNFWAQETPFVVTTFLNLLIRCFEAEVYNIGRKATQLRNVSKKDRTAFDSNIDLSIVVQGLLVYGLDDVENLCILKNLQKDYSEQRLMQQL